MVDLVGSRTDKISDEPVGWAHGDKLPKGPARLGSLTV